MTLAPEHGELTGVDAPDAVAGSATGAVAAASVTAVLVCHDGVAWLPGALRGLAAQRRPADLVVAVDVGSSDGTAELLAQARARGTVDLVVQVPRDCAFGESVRRALAASPVANASRDSSGEAGGAASEQWLWLLHDDCAPDPRALQELLETGSADPAIAVVGPKLVGGRDGRALREVGVSISATGRRETGLDPDEVDQGQHDGTRDVLAVSTAAMLVRRPVWDALDGLEPALPLFRDDADFGWRARRAGHRVVCETAAVVRHAEAARRGLRPLAAVRGRALRADRQGAVRTLLLNSPLWLLPVLLTRLLGATALRALGLLLAGAPRAAGVQVGAALGVLARPDLLVRGRAARRRTKVVGHYEVRPFLVRSSASWRLLREAVGLVFAPASQRERGWAPLPALRPLVALVVLVSVAAVWPLRHLVGEGRLVGGPLGGVPDSSTDLWSALGSSWQPVGLGASGPAEAWTAPVAALGTLLGDRPGLALGILLLGCSPLAAVTAYLSLGGALPSRLVRTWAAGTYALLPVATGAAAGGRLGTALLLVLLPPLARLAVLALRPRAAGGLPASVGASLLLAVAAAGTPVVWLLAAGLGFVALLLVAVRRPRAVPGLLARMALVLGVPAVLLLPLTARLVRAGLDPAAWVAEAGWSVPGLADLSLDPWHVLLVHPGGPGAYALAVTVPLLAAALAALLVPGPRAGAVQAAWLVAIAGLAAAWLTSQVDLPAAGGTGQALPAWPGASLAVAGAALVLAAGLGAEGARTWLRGRSFGLGHLALGALVPVCLVVPLAAAAVLSDLDVPALHPVVDDRLEARPSPLERARPVLPPFVASDLAGPERPRALVLSSSGAGTGSAQVSWLLDRGSGTPLGAERLEVPAAAHEALDAVVAEVVAGRGGSAAAGLPHFGIRYVLVRGPVDPELARALDSTPGLARRGRQQPDALWQVAEDRTAGVAARVRVTRPGGRFEQAVAAGRVSARGQVAPGGDDRLLVLAEPADPRWRASLDGVALPVAAARPTGLGWAQVFDLPAGGGEVRVWFSDPHAQSLDALRVATLGAVGLLGVLALLGLLPVAHRRREDAS